MSTSGAARALLSAVETFTAAQTFSAGLTTNAATISGALATSEIISTTRAVSATYPVALTDEVILADATAAAFVVTLPTAASVPGRRITVKKIDASVNAVTVASGGGTIDGAVSIALTAQNWALTVISGGANWWVVNQVAAGIL